MSESRGFSRLARPFLVIVLTVNGLMFCLGVLSDHSTIVIVVYLILALLNFVGAWKVGSDWRSRLGRRT